MSDAWPRSGPVGNLRLAAGIGLVGAIVLALAIPWLRSQGTPDKAASAVGGIPAPIQAADQEAADSPRVLGWAGGLKVAGWDEAAALSVCRLNERWWAALENADPEHVRLQLAVLGHLAGHDPPWKVVARYPECAGLMLACGDPTALANLLGGDDHTQIAALFAGCAAPDDAKALLAVLVKHRSAVVGLYERFPGSESVFLGNGEVHNRWLASETEEFRKAEDAVLASFLQFVTASRKEMAERLAKDEDGFRKAWKKLKDVVGTKDGAFEHFVDVPNLWGTLDLPDGEELLRVWQGAAPMLLEEHREVRDAVRAVLASGDGLAVEELVRKGQDKGVMGLLRLRKNVSVKTLRACLRKLRAEGAGYPALLEKWRGLNDAVLAMEVGDPQEPGALEFLPGYSLYAIYDKMSKGRELEATEWGAAALDIALTFTPIPGGGKAVSTGLKAGAKAMTKEVAKKAAKAGAELAARRLGQAASKQLARCAAKQQAAWGVSAILSGMRGSLAGLGTAVDNLARIDITGPLKYFASRSKWVRQTLRPVGLEARLYMRKDARVRIHLLRLADAGLGAAQETNRMATALAFFLPPGDAPAVPKRANESFADADEREWKQNNAAWWLVHSSSGQFELLAGAGGRP